MSSFGGITSSDSIPTPEFERKQARLSISQFKTISLSLWAKRQLQGNYCKEIAAAHAAPETVRARTGIGE